MENNSSSRVAVETFLTGTKKGGLVLVGGEISEIANITTEDINSIVKEALNKTIKTSFEDFNLQNLSIFNELTPQSEEIRAAVEDDIDQGAGDQGIMVGFATNKTESFMPPTFDKSRNIQKDMWELQNSNEFLDLDEQYGIDSENITDEQIDNEEYFEAKMGGEAVRDLLRKLDIKAEMAKLTEIAKGKFSMQKKEEALKRLRIFKKFDNSLNVKVLEKTARTAQDASLALGCEVGAIVKSLLFRAENSFVLCLVSGDKKCSLNKLKKIPKKMISVWLHLSK